MVSDKKIVIHVGMHKTGTTTLQHDVFPNLPGVFYVGDNLPQRKAFIEFLREVAWGNQAHFDLQDAMDRRTELLSNIREDIVLISFEELFGDLYWNFPNNFVAAERLKSLFPEARILLVLRRQADWLESAWRQSLRCFQFRPLKPFLYYGAGGFGRRAPLDYRVGISALELDYRPYVENYARLFGAANLEVIPYEMSHRNPRLYYELIGKLVERDIPAPDRASHRRNRSFSGLACLIALVLNRLVVCRDHNCGLIPDRPGYRFFDSRRHRGLVYRLAAGISARMSLPYILEHYVDRLLYVDWRFMNAGMRDEIFAYYRDANRNLDEEFSIGLKDYNYY